MLTIQSLEALSMQQRIRMSHRKNSISLSTAITEIGQKLIACSARLCA